MATQLINLPLDELEKLAGEGLTKREIAEHFGLQLKQLQNQIQNKIQVREAVERGEAAFRKREMPLSKPQKPLTTSDEVLGAIKNGSHTLSDIHLETNIPFHLISDATNTLLQYGKIRRRVNGTMTEYHIVDAPKTPPPSNGKVVSDARLEHTLEQTERVEKNITPPYRIKTQKSKAKTKKKQTALAVTKATPIATPAPPEIVAEAETVNGNHLEGRTKFLLKAARLEIEFMRLWNEPSSKADVLQKEIDAALKN